MIKAFINVWMFAPQHPHWYETLPYDWAQGPGWSCLILGSLLTVLIGGLVGVLIIHYRHVEPTRQFAVMVVAMVGSMIAMVFYQCFIFAYFYASIAALGVGYLLYQAWSWGNHLPADWQPLAKWPLHKSHRQ